MAKSEPDRTEPERLTDGERLLLHETCGALWTWGTLAPGWSELPEELRDKVLSIAERRESLRHERRERKSKR